MIYNKGTGENKSWILSEGAYTPDFLAKCESIMCQGNGYMCIRAAMEETDCAASRFTFVAGTFNMITPDDECTRLPNCADTTEISIEIDGETVSPAAIVKDSYERDLNLRTGLLTRSYVWAQANGSKFKITYERCVSLKNLHLAAYKITILPLSVKADKIIIKSGINGDTIPFSGHFINSSASYENNVMSLCDTTNESNITFAVSCINNTNTDAVREYAYNNSKTLTETLTLSPENVEAVVFEKIVTVFTTRDSDINIENGNELAAYAIEYTDKLSTITFDEILKSSAAEWQTRIWSERDIIINSQNETDQLSIRFALYHLTAMAPVHDNRMNIGAKGLSGPGYCGHAFWDTEVYMLPYFIFAAPSEARSLVEYRSNSLPAARRYAKKVNCEGARFPWEASWITDEETTPKWCETGDIEIHITSDVAFGAYYYYTVTGDEDFMKSSGYELILDCAKFWATRLEWNSEKNRYEITNVMGPNEYKSNINNNAYTNHMAAFVIELALSYSKKLKADDKPLYDRLNSVLELDKYTEIWEKRLPLIYLPRENSDGIIPEDDTFLSLVDFTNGRRLSDMMEEARELALKYQYPDSMICKQADVVALLYLRENLFSNDTKIKNFYFYEAHCFHDSSLSLSTFSCLAADLHEDDMAYHLYERAAMIDMGDNMKSSDDGVHAASLGGLWQCCTLGFGGVRLFGTELRIQPNLPENWSSVAFNIWWHGSKLKITADKAGFEVENLTDSNETSFIHNNKTVKFTNKIRIEY